jgi:hypothetical protein
MLLKFSRTGTAIIVMNIALYNLPIEITGLGFNIAMALEKVACRFIADSRKYRYLDLMASAPSTDPFGIEASTLTARYGGSF